MPEKLSSGPKIGYDLSKTGSGLNRGPNINKKMVGAPYASGVWPAPGSTLDLDFANNRGWVKGLGQGGVMDGITFSRASNATFVGPDGLLKSYSNQGALGENLLTFPQDFDNGAWTKSRSSILPNVTATPDGTLTADKLVEDTTSGNHLLRTSGITVNNGVSYTASVFVKAAERTEVFIELISGTADKYATMNLTTGAKISGGADVTTLSAGNGWWRFSFSITTASTSCTFYVITSTGGSLTYQGDGTSGIYIWGAQLELGSTATTYYPTNIGLPRFDWASTAQVAQRNLLRWSQSDAYWLAGGTTPPTVTNGVTWQGESCMSAVFTSSSATGYNGSRATRSDTSVIEPRVSVVSGTSYVTSFYVSLSRALTGSEAVTIYFTGQHGFPTITINSSNSSSYNGVWLRTISSAGTANASGTDFPTVYLSGALGSNLTVYVCKCQIEVGTSATDYQQIGSKDHTTTPLSANPTCNGILIEESRANRLLWCRDASQTPNRNLLSYSADMSSGWTPLNITVSAGTTDVTDPFGGNNAIKFTETSATGVHKTNSPQYYALSVGSTLTASCYAQKGTRDIFYIRASSGVECVQFFDLTNGALLSNSGSSSSYLLRTGATITSVGSGWYLCTVTYVVGSSATGVIVIPGVSAADGVANYSYTGDTSKNLYVYGPQLEIASSATTYEATTSSGAIWSKQGITAAKDQTGIDGVANAASSLTASADGGTCTQTITLASGSRTGSVYLKRITGTGNVQVSLDGSTWSTVDLSSTEWRRIVLSGTVTNPVVGIKLATNGDAVAMDYGQVEDGAFATSPVLTTTASATRSADVATISGVRFSDFYRQDEGTLYIDNKSIRGRSGFYNSVNVNQNFIHIVNDGSVTQTSAINTAGTGQFSNSISVQIDDRKAAIAYKTDNTTSAVNATIGVTDASVLLPSVNYFAIGTRGTSGDGFINGTMRRIIYFQKRLSDFAITVLTGGSR